MAKKLSSNLFKVSIAPENGADATTYWLVPSVTQVKRKADGSHLPEYVSCECFSKTGDGNPVSGGGTIKFVLTYKTGSNSAEFVYGSRIIITSDMAAISFRLYVGGTKVDEKTVAVVEDGADGLPGPAGMRGRMPFPSGAFDLLTTYTATDAITPIVYYEAGKTYYTMRKNGNSVGIDPAQDYASNGSDSTWIPFENYKAIFTEILMANFAKLASAVFFGDYMFSQHGKNASGNDTTDYSEFDPTKIGQSDCPFTPNLMMDLLLGRLLASGGKTMFDSDGSGHLANGNIKFTADGSLSVKGYIQESYQLLDSRAGMGSLNSIYLSHDKLILNKADDSDTSILNSTLVLSDATVGGDTVSALKLELYKPILFSLYNMTNRPWCISLDSRNGNFSIVSTVKISTNIIYEEKNVLDIYLVNGTNIDLMFLPTSIMVVNVGSKKYNYYKGTWMIKNRMEFRYTNIFSRNALIPSPIVV